ncbi:hypothetical protein U1Q18_012224 [Sarracenia purpurea var. burkii]
MLHTTPAPLAPTPAPHRTTGCSPAPHLHCHPCAPAARCTVVCPLPPLPTQRDATARPSSRTCAVPPSSDANVACSNTSTEI